MATDTFLVCGELSDEPSLLVSINGVIEACNEAFAALCGAPSPDLRGRRMESLISEHLAEYLRACARSDKRLSASFTLRSRTGTSEHCFYGIAHRAEREPTPPRVVLVLRPILKQDDAHAALVVKCAAEQIELLSACKHPPKALRVRQIISRVKRPGMHCCLTSGWFDAPPNMLPAWVSRGRSEPVQPSVGS